MNSTLHRRQVLTGGQRSSANLASLYRLHSPPAQKRRCTALLHNYRATVTYDGTHYYGFQVQDTARTIQGELERSLTKIQQTDREQLKLTGSGRTDAGVHATGQVRPMWSLNVIFRYSMSSIVIIHTVDEFFKGH